MSMVSRFKSEKRGFAGVAKEARFWMLRGLKFEHTFTGKTRLSLLYRLQN